MPQIQCVSRIEPDLADLKRRFKNIELSVVDFTGKNGVYEVL